MTDLQTALLKRVHDLATDVVIIGTEAKINPEYKPYFMSAQVKLNEAISAAIEIGPQPMTAELLERLVS